jgi:hypothetical protein
LIDSLTPWHLRILRFSLDPGSYGVRYGAGIDHELERVFPELQKQRAFYSQIANDLVSRSLIFIRAGGSIYLQQFGSPTLKVTTDLGNCFLAFISPPS